MTDWINQTARRVPAWFVYILGLGVLVAIVLPVAFGTAGPDPVKPLEKELGERGLQFLILALCITPLRWRGVNLLKFRRAIGLVAFAFVLFHFLTWVVLDMGLRWEQILQDLTKRPYIIIGFAAFVALLPLAITSNAASIRRLGTVSWKRLHWLAYPATLAGAVHFVMIGKVYSVESGMYLFAVMALLFLRWWHSRKTAQ